MEGDPACPGTPAADLSRSAPDCALRWLSSAATAGLPLSALLAEFARAFWAGGAGVAQLPGGEPIAAHPENLPPAVVPWGERPELVREAALSPSAVGVRDGGRHWLLAAVDGDERASWLLWLYAPASRDWSPTEAAALALAGQALARHLRRPESAPRWARPLLLRRRQQRFDEVASALRRVAHDYGNVLTGILGFSELALTHTAQRPPLASYLSEIRGAAQVGERLTNTLRLFTRRQWAKDQPARLPAVVADEVGRLGDRFPGVSLEVAVPPDLPAVAIDEEPLRHVLAQLLDNAAEAVASDGSVRLSARPVALTADQCLELFGAAEPGPHVEVVVADTGCGLSADARQRLLVEPFFTTKARHRGYGLGVVYGILSAHRGALAVEPAAVGTVARAYLPAAPAVAPVPSEAAGERVLVVDDDPMIVQLVRATLQRAGYRVATATTADEALRSFTRTAEPFRLVVSDVVMPHVNGYDLARLLRTHDAGVNVLFMTGEAPPPQPGETFDLLTKPFGPEGLLRAVRSALERGPRRVPAADRIGDEVVLTPTP